MSKISEEFTGNGEAKTIPIAFSGSHVTALRPPYIPSKDEQEAIPNPGTARVNIAPSSRAPNGTTEGNWAEENSDISVLHQHCAFWDSDGDGIIWPLDTYRGFRAIGFNIPFSVLSMIYLDKVYKCKHGSDTGTYDNEGRFIPQKFEDFFSKYGQANGGEGLTSNDIWNGIKGQRLIMDPVGWGCEMAEWLATYLFLWPEDGIIKKEDVRKVYDGSIFPEMAAKRSRKGQKKE